MPRYISTIALMLALLISQLYSYRLIQEIREQDKIIALMEKTATLNKSTIKIADANFDSLDKSMGSLFDSYNKCMAMLRTK